MSNDPSDDIKFLDPAKNKGGRPRKLTLDDDMRRQLRGLGALRANDWDIAGFFQVGRSTWMAFKAANPEAKEILECGAGAGNVSLRRAQWAAAMKGDRTMLVWLGKQNLGQRDVQRVEGPGPGGAFPTVDLSKLNDEQLKQYIALGQALGVTANSGPGEDPGSGGDPSDASS